MLIYTFTKSKEDKKNIFVMLITNIGIAYIFEYFVLNLFRAYKYMPKVFKQQTIDNIFGAILSQAVFVPITSVFITALNLRWKAKLLFGLYFYIIDIFFLKLKVYKHNWWKSVYTLTLIPIYFVISDKWHSLLKKDNPIIKLLTLYLSILSTGINLYFLLAVMGVYRFGKGKYPSWREHFIIAPIYCMFLSLYAAWANIKRGLLPKLSILLVCFGVDSLLIKMNILKTKFRIPIENLFVHVSMIIVSWSYKRWIYEYRK